VITADGRCSREICCRIGMSKDAINRKKEIMIGGISTTLKTQIITTVMECNALLVWALDIV